MRESETEKKSQIWELTEVDLMANQILRPTLKYFIHNAYYS